MNKLTTFDFLTKKDEILIVELDINSEGYKAYLTKEDGEEITLDSLNEADREALEREIDYKMEFDDYYQEITSHGL